MIVEIFKEMVEKNLAHVKAHRECIGSASAFRGIASCLNGKTSLVAAE